MIRRAPKRLFDILFSVCLGLILGPIILLIALAILLLDGRPIFYVSERMKSPTVPINLYKFRTMSADLNDSGVSGGDKSKRITRVGRYVRASRMDELPQLWNILRGDISFVGPRPPLRQYVEGFPELYEGVLRSKPGVTGLASLYFHSHEEGLLKACSTQLETDTVYRRRCIPRKAKIDLIYQRHSSLCFDLVIIARTVLKVLR